MSNRRAEGGGFSGVQHLGECWYIASMNGEDGVGEEGSTRDGACTWGFVP